MIRVTAPAKINYFLEITGKRRDGYHMLSILFQTISLGDELTFEAAPTLTLRCSDKQLPTDDRNLVMRAALRLQQALRERRGATIFLKKKTPMGAGLGGGSSDAAAVLRTLPKLWKRKVPEALFHRLARRLGADVPFFLKGGLCAATGIGDRLKPLPTLPKTWLVLVYPGFGVSTKEAYGRVQLPLAVPRSIREIEKALRKKNMDNVLPLFFNRFEELVFSGHPQLPLLKGRLVELGALRALMSGSGSSVFGIVASEAEGRRVLRRVRKEYPQSWLVHTIDSASNARL